MIRKACPADLPGILVIYENARAFMRASGNPTQWGDGRPFKETLEEDIRIGQLYVMEADGAVYAVFAFILGDDPTYAVIEDGAWISDRPYGTVHRIAGDGSRSGVFRECSEFCLSMTGHVRIDTHKDNIPMQTAILREGYSYCGIIYIEDGSPRLAYELER